MEEGGGEPPGVLEIHCNTESLDGSTIFHLIKDTVAFLLYMHQQIPSIFEDLCLEFDAMRTEFKELETEIARFQGTASLRRKQLGRKREVKLEIRRLDKLMKSISSLETALQLIIRETPNIQEVILIIGSSPIRPLHVYQMRFSSASPGPQGEPDFEKSKAAEGLSRKAIRGLISKGAGSTSYPGTLKLFLLIKAQSSLNLPLHFLPKHDFRYNKKIVPLWLQFKCRSKVMEIVSDNDPSQIGQSLGFDNYTPSELIWYQCRHVIKGIAMKSLEEE